MRMKLAGRLGPPSEYDPGYPVVDLAAVLALCSALTYGQPLVSTLLAAALALRWARSAF